MFISLRDSKGIRLGRVHSELKKQTSTKIRKMKREGRCIVHLDMDAFYAQVESVRLGIDSRVQPYALEQWNNFLAVNYPAREWFGIKRMDSVWEGKKKVLQYYLQHPGYQFERSSNDGNGSTTMVTPPEIASLRGSPSSEKRSESVDSPDANAKKEILNSHSTSLNESTLQQEVLRVEDDSLYHYSSAKTTALTPTSCENSIPPQLTLLYSPIPLYHVGEVEYAYYQPNQVDKEIGNVLHLSKVPPSVTLLPRGGIPALSSSSSPPLSIKSKEKPFCVYNRTEFKVSLEPFRAASQKIFAVLRSFPGVEVAKAGIDEAFLDVTEAAEKELRNFMIAAHARVPPPSQLKEERSGGKVVYPPKETTEGNTVPDTSVPMPHPLPWSSLSEICACGLLEPSTVLVKDQSSELNHILEEKGTSLKEAYEAPMKWLREELQSQERERNRLRKSQVGSAYCLEVKKESKSTSPGGMDSQGGRWATLLSSLSSDLSLDYFFPSELNPSVLFCDDLHREKEKASAVPTSTGSTAIHFHSCELRNGGSSHVDGMTSVPSSGANGVKSAHRLTTTEIDFLSYAALLAAASRVVLRIRETLYTTLRFDCSAGIAHNCLIAKILSASHKPRKQVLLWPHLASSVVGCTQITKMRGFGGKWGDMLTRHQHELRAVEIWNRPLKYDLHQTSNSLLPTSLSRVSGRAGPPPIRDVHSFFRVRGVDGNRIFSPQTPHMWSSLKEFPKPKMIRYYAQLEGWIGALCHDLWCRHRYYEDYYRPYFCSPSSLSSSSSSAAPSRGTQRKSSAKDGLRVGCYAKVVQIRVQQWASSGYRAYPHPHHGQCTFVEEEKYAGKCEGQENKAENRVEGRGEVKSEGAGRAQEGEVRSRMKQDTIDRRDDDDGEGGGGDGTESLSGDVQSGGDGNEEGEEEEEEEREEGVRSQHPPRRSRWGSPREEVAPMHYRTWKRESLLLPLPDGEENDTSPAPTSISIAPGPPLVTLKGLITTAKKLLKELERDLLREDSRSSEKKTIEVKNGCHQGVLKCGIKEEENSTSSIFLSAASCTGRREEDGPRALPTPCLSRLGNSNVKQEPFSFLEHLPTTSSSTPPPPLTTSLLSSSSCNSSSASSPFVPPSEEPPSLLHPIRSLTVSFQYSKARKYAIKVDPNRSRVSSGTSPLQTLQGFFLRAANEGKKSATASRLPLSTAPGEGKSSCMASRRPGTSPASPFPIPAEKVVAIDDADEEDDKSGDGKAVAQPHQSREKNDHILHAITAEEDEGVMWECRLPERQGRREEVKKGREADSFPSMSRKRDITALTSTFLSTCIPSSSSSSILPSSDVEQVSPPPVPNCLDHFFHSALTKGSSQPHNFDADETSKMKKRKKKDEKRDNEFIVID